MKKLIILFALVLGMVANAQTEVIPFEDAKNIYKYGDFYACVYDYSDGNSKGKIFDNTGTQIGSDYIFNKYTSSGDTNTSHILFDNNYVYIIGTVKPSASGGSWNKISKYNKANSTLIEEKLVRGITLKPKLISGILYLDIKLTPNYDFLSSGWDSVISYHGGNEEHNITTFDSPTWASYLGDFPDAISDIVKTTGNNIFVKTRRTPGRVTHYWKIDANNGNILLHNVAPSNIDIITYDRFRDKLLWTNNTVKKTTYHNWDGSLVKINSIPTIGGMNFSYPQWTNPLSNVTILNNGFIGTCGKDIYLFSNGNEKTLSIHNKTKKKIDYTMDHWIVGYKYIEIQEDRAIIAIKYVGNNKSFAGVNLPDTNGVYFWFAYTDIFTEPSGEIHLNNISTHHIVGVVENVYEENGSLVHKNNFPVSYVIIDQESNIPQEGTDARSWGLWTVPSNFTEYNVNGVGVVKQDEIGRRYIDIAPYDETAQMCMNMRIYFISQNHLGIEKNDKATFEMYPNPATDILNIKIGEGEIQKIKITNVNGQLIFDQKFNNQKEIQISLSFFQNGIYFVKIFDDKDNISNLKLIKK